MTRTLSQWLEYIGGIHVSAIDMGLERVLPVASYLGIIPIKTQQDQTDKKTNHFYCRRHQRQRLNHENYRCHL